SAFLLGGPPCSPPVPYATLFRSLVPLALVDFLQLRRGKPLAARHDERARLGLVLVALRSDAQVQQHEVEGAAEAANREDPLEGQDRKSTRLNSSHVKSSYAVFCL